MSPKLVLLPPSKPAVPGGGAENWTHTRLFQRLLERKAADFPLGGGGLLLGPRLFRLLLSLSPRRRPQGAGLNGARRRIAQNASSDGPGLRSQGGHDWFGRWGGQGPKKSPALNRCRG